MADPTPKLYEGLFLVSQSAVSTGLGSIIDTVRGMLDRAGAEVVTLHRWDERKLAYPINAQKRGTYLLALFKVAPVQIANIERDCNLSEDVLRVLMTRADHFGETEIEQAKKDAQDAAVATKVRDSGGESGGDSGDSGGESDGVAANDDATVEAGA